MVYICKAFYFMMCVVFVRSAFELLGAGYKQGTGITFSSSDTPGMSILLSHSM